jgi:hypothetical protein
MKRNQYFIGVFVLSVLLLVGCGPSEAEIATMTASVWTPTPPPTATPTPTPIPSPTPTPVPYGLTVSIVEEDETPIAGAQITLAEIEGDKGVQTADESGMAAWSNLPGETVSLTVSAQGYVPTEFSGNIERGDNQMVVILAKDPHGILPSEACAPGESLLYVEDFQDGHALYWPDINLRAGGWDIGPMIDSEENLTAIHAPIQNFWTRMNNADFKNAVFRFQFFTTGERYLTFHWQIAPEPYELDGETIENSEYQIDIASSAVWVMKHIQPVMSASLYFADRESLVGSWHDVEISRFEETLELWLDGVQLLAYEDPKPNQGGGVMIEAGDNIDEVDQNAIAYFDNFTICELTAPFVPMPTPEPE